MLQRRMSKASRRSLNFADSAEIVGDEESWAIRLIQIPPLPVFLLDRKVKSWFVTGGDEAIVYYPSVLSAAQAIQRGRPDLPYKVVQIDTMSRQGKDKTYEQWLRETIAAAEIAGVLNNLLGQGVDINDVLEKSKRLRFEMK
ncbi:hypothetical protein F2Q65_09285 [Thiohalocapsa marina]|uniref:Uncharacterized protein n=1 Tax=Thiohalocapsa marina TaxID=424902 RepID=A0A5M8FSL4_9GAMM|nr:hypothetical protein [Thiohalocapsa marina]KAA6185282.1 hypothetical protein F2Q65_09285 [Thiohalocapsa marina]